MKTIFLVLLIFSFSTSGFAQKALKINAHFQYQAFENSYTRDSITYLYEESNLSILPSPTFSIYTEKGSFHEIGLSQLQFGIDDNKSTQSKTDLSVITSN